MPIARPAIAADTARFGRKRVRAAVQPAPAPRIGEDAQLFLATFAAGFVFVAMFIA